jgi:hypothetical protein
MKAKHRKQKQSARPTPAPVERPVEPSAVALPDDDRIARWQLAALLCILLLAAAARLHRIGEFSLWLDEIWTIETATGRGSPHLHLPEQVIVSAAPDLTSPEGGQPWWRIWTSMRDMTHPPLYIIVLRWWMDAFGAGAVALRALSALASLIAVFLMYDVVRIQAGRTPALWAAALMAVAGPQVQFAQEARPYAFLVMLSLVAASPLVRIERSGATPARLATFGLALLALMLTHYFAVGTAAALVLYGLLRTRGRDRRNLLIAVAIAGVTFALAWGPFMWGHRSTFSDQNTNFLTDDAPGRLLRLIGRLFATAPRLLNEYLSRNLAAMVVLALVLGSAVYLARRRRELLLWCLWFALSVGVVALFDLMRSTRHLHFIRYAMLASPAVYAILATLTARVREPTARHALPAMALLICAVTLPHARIAMWKANWRDLTKSAQASLRPGDVLLIAGDDPMYARSAYLCMSHYMPKPGPPFALVTGRADPALVAQLKAAPGVLLVVGIEGDLAPHLAILGDDAAAVPMIGATGAGGLMRVTWPRSDGK